MCTEPASGCTRPIISRSSVDLPQPLGPIKAVVWPGAIVRSICVENDRPAVGLRDAFQLDHLTLKSVGAGMEQVADNTREGTLTALFRNCPASRCG